MSSTLRLPLFGRPTLEQRRASIPLITELITSAGLKEGEAEKVATAIMRAWLGYLPEPLSTRVRGELSPRLYRKVGFAGFPQGSRAAEPRLFFEQVANDTGLREERAKVLAQTVMTEWSRQVSPGLLRAVAGYMPRLFKVVVPSRTGLVWDKPRSPLEPGESLPLCTAPDVPGHPWRCIGATFGKLERHYSGRSFEELRAAYAALKTEREGR